jgi:hypothetical protein
VALPVLLGAGKMVAHTAEAAQELTHSAPVLERLVLFA